MFAKQLRMSYISLNAEDFTTCAYIFFFLYSMASIISEKLLIFLSKSVEINPQIVKSGYFAMLLIYFSSVAVGNSCNFMHALIVYPNKIIYKIKRISLSIFNFFLLHKDCLQTRLKLKSVISYGKAYFLKCYFNIYFGGTLWRNTLTHIENKGLKLKRLKILSI